MELSHCRLGALGFQVATITTLPVSPLTYHTPQGDEVMHLVVAHWKGLRGSIVCVKDNVRAKIMTQGKKPSSCSCLPRGFWVLTEPRVKG